MGIELPPELAEVAAQTGVKWPEADEEAMSRSAQAWRDAAGSMSTLTTDADTTARSALSTVSGAAAEAASTEWKEFVEPDSGHLTSVVRGCNDAADRLEHAASQVGQAKVEIVRNLVALAQTQDAANAAASTGHPFALAGLDTVVQGTAVNVAHIESQLVSAVQPGTGVDMAGHQNPVNANPGTHLLAGITTGAAELPETLAPGVTTLAGETVQGSTDLATNLAVGTTQGTAETLHHAADLPGLNTPGTTTTGDTLHRTAALADTVVENATALTDDATNLPGTAAHGASSPLPSVAAPLVDSVGNVASGNLLPSPADGLLPGTSPGQPGNLLPGHPIDPTTGQTGNLPGHPDTPGRPLDPMTDPPGNVVPGPGDPTTGSPGQDADITGPVPIHNLPTPPTGQTYQAGFAGGLEPSAAPANLPPAPGPAPYGGAPNLGNPQPYAPPAFGGAPGAPPVPGMQAPAAPPPLAAPAGVPRPAMMAAPGYPAPTPDRPAPDQPPPRKQIAGPPGAPPPVRGDTDQVLAAFWIHMFPIGHLPVASYRPARQLPPPPEEMDYAAGLRFEPGDHPKHHLVDGMPRLQELKAHNTNVDPDAKTVRLEPVKLSDGLPAADPTVAPLLEGHDPLGGAHERDWDRRYLVRLGSVTAQGISPEGLEYNWPTSEQYPEGGSAPGEAETLAADTVIDRFGGPDGRVFAADATPFAQRSLPPAHKDSGYRRYRVVRPLPVWRAVSAAWFGQPGGGIRYRTTHTATELVALGYLEELL